MSFSCRILDRFSRRQTHHCTQHLSICITAFACEGSDHYTTLYLTCSQVGFAVKSAPPVTFHRLKFPSHVFTETGLVSQRSSHSSWFTLITTALFSDDSLAGEVKACLLVPLSRRVTCRTSRFHRIAASYLAQAPNLNLTTLNCLCQLDHSIVSAAWGSKLTHIVLSNVPSTLHNQDASQLCDVNSVCGRSLGTHNTAIQSTTF